jgi:hypothetical protein
MGGGMGVTLEYSTWWCACWGADVTLDATTLGAGEAMAFGGNSTMKLEPGVMPCGTTAMTDRPLPSGALTSMFCPGDTPGGTVTERNTNKTMIEKEIKSKRKENSKLILPDTISPTLPDDWC